MDQNSLIRAMAFVLGVILLLAVAWGAFKAVTEAKADYSPLDAVETLDTDLALAQTIDSLEAHWNRRLNYHFEVEQDPLFLGRVVSGFSYKDKGFREFDEGGEPRLSATVTAINDSSAAIIKYLGKSIVLQVGDRFGEGYVVEEIKEKEVILTKSGRRIILYSKPIETLWKEDSRRGSFNLDEW